MSPSPENPAAGKSAADTPPHAPALELTLSLDDIASLFHSPVVDPLHGQCETESGVARLVQALSARRVKAGQHLRLTLHIPEPQITADLAHRTRDALHRYAHLQFGKKDRRHAVWRRQLRYALRSGLIFLVGCMVLATLAQRASSAPELLRRLFSEGFLIVGWVAMWRPIDSLLFEGWPHARDKRVYACLQRAEVIVEPHRAASGGTHPAAVDDPVP